MTLGPSSRAGAAIREHVDGENDARAHLEARNQFVQAALVRGRRPGRRAGWAPFVLAAAAFFLVGGAWALFDHVRSPLTFTVGADRSPGLVAAYIEPGDAEALPLYFSDGTVVTLDVGARARVARTSRNGAALLVESGGLNANVAHRPLADWDFVAGPFTVHVTGTAFHLSWEPGGPLDIQMKSGIVTVRGPGAEAGVEVGDHFTSAAPTASAASNEPEPSASDEPMEPEPALAPSAAKPALHARGTSKKSAVAPSSARNDGVPAVEITSNAGVSWPALVARGDYTQVTDMAERRGLDATLGSADVDDLAALADAARFSGKASLAEHALQALRTRFSESPRARSAAFLLGRMADDAGNARSAVSWYERYSREAPNGSLAAEALGRRMLALRRLNDVESTRRAAREYLERYPQGAHAGIAHEIVEP